ncbi:MAG: 4a-hydroxytetrahydrobiopterin dehydratase [Candidatus Buchananbacteria bacterium]|nr:4a-hydroxytetrahydrobiopterin dehydratase [Candidatus Buchananbacteria bacterium]
MNDNLTLHHCIPCEGGTKPFTLEELKQYLPVVPEWKVSDSEPLSISRTIICKDFKDAVTLITKIAEIAEAEGHHPDLYLHDFKKLTITLSTHAIKGLSINDFIVAAKIDQVI